MSASICCLGNARTLGTGMRDTYRFWLNGDGGADDPKEISFRCRCRGKCPYLTHRAPIPGHGHCCRRLPGRSSAMSWREREQRDLRDARSARTHAETQAMRCRFTRIFRWCNVQGDRHDLMIRDSLDKQCVLGHKLSPEGPASVHYSRTFDRQHWEEFSAMFFCRSGQHEPWA
jgi:hypothetical protein